MRPFEWGIAAVLAAACVARWRAGTLRAFARDALLLGAGAWLGEDTCIRWYGFYAYSRDWTVFVDRVPLLVALIWPFVVVSARDLAAHLGVSRAAALFVLYDALLIEPIAVQAGLWRWTEGAVFGVPLIGLAGWAFYALFALWLLERLRGPARLAAPVLAAAATHLALLATWWGALRWLAPLRSPAPGALLAVMAWLLAALLVAALVRRRLARPPLLLWAPRAAGAAYFFALLGAGAPAPALVAYAAAFGAPWAIALARRA